jgi:hypothetical protein
MSEMIRVAVTFFAVWILVGVIGVFIEAVFPLPRAAVGLTGIVVGAVAAAWEYRRQRAPS